jgi:hypothetical protein
MYYVKLFAIGVGAKKVAFGTTPKRHLLGLYRSKVFGYSAPTLGRHLSKRRS